MTIYYVDSTATGGTNAGTSWANAYLAFGSAVSAATASGDFIYVSHAHNESLSADTTYTFANNVQVLCVNSSTGALATTAVIGAQATNYNVTLNGAYKVYIYGITLKAGTGTTTKHIYVGTTDGGHFELEVCNIYLSGGSASVLFFGYASSMSNGYVKLYKCGIHFRYSGQYIANQGCRLDADGSYLISGSASPSTLLKNAASGGPGTESYFFGCDLSLFTGVLVGDLAGYGKALFSFFNCSFGNGFSVLTSATTVINKGQTTVNLYNCASGDTHYNFGHYDAFGKTTATITIYANDGASYDGANRVAWKIETTGACSYWTPYVSPWIQKYHSGTSSITPRLEILRDGSATAYYDDEVWSEWSYQGTSGYPLGVMVNDRMTPLGSHAAQGSSSLGASNWTGENATAWFGKLEPTAAITPAEIGHIMARVVVGATSATVYVDPTIRGLS